MKNLESRVAGPESANRVAPDGWWMGPGLVNTQDRLFLRRRAVSATTCTLWAHLYGDPARRDGSSDGKLSQLLILMRPHAYRLWTRASTSRISPVLPAEWHARREMLHSRRRHDRQCPCTAGAESLPEPRLGRASRRDRASHGLAPSASRHERLQHRGIPGRVLVPVEIGVPCPEAVAQRAVVVATVDPGVDRRGD